MLRPREVPTILSAFLRSRGVVVCGFVVVIIVCMISMLKHGHTTHRVHIDWSKLQQFKPLDTKQDLVMQLRKNWILPPFAEPRKLSSPNMVHYSQPKIGQSRIIENLYKHPKPYGFFIEAGAANGEIFSNSLFFEKSWNWTGLLVEANPKLFAEIQSKKRHAYMLNACLSPGPEPVKLPFRMAEMIGGLESSMKKTHMSRVEKELEETDVLDIQCFPLAAVLEAIGVGHVDYWSLDVEGAEIDILKSFPFDDIKVDVLSIEYYVSGDDEGTARKLQDIKSLMEGKYGYKDRNHTDGTDVIFVRNDVDL